jgi:2-oxoglutarate ferredoxin oxidoreductase subunit beta
MGAILRAIHSLELKKEELLFVSGIGCAGWIPSPTFDMDTMHTLHGRAIAFATGAKLFKPSLNVIVISGDGDLAAIGGNHLIHGARRNIDITVILSNNQIYGMTGGQSAPTTQSGFVTSTEPDGVKEQPFDLCRLTLAAGATKAARFPVTRPAELETAIRNAISTKGFTLVEALSPCPTQFGRLNKIEKITDLYDKIDQMCVKADLNTKLNPGQMAIGEF